MSLLFSFMELGVYIHYPWCRDRCPYCDFAVAVAPLDAIPHRAYLSAILDELALRAPTLAGRQLVSIYVGGGTPSLWEPACLAEAVAAVRAAFGDAAPAEVTIEANPTDCTPERVAAWRAAGVDRISIGMQSLAPADLVALGRDHRMGQGLDALDAAEASGARVTADLILGIPGARDPLGGVRQLAARPGLGHMSIYELSVEEGTPLARNVARGEVTLEPDDRLADLLIATHELMTGAGFEHYEVSSYARPGARARHNSLYWQGAEFLGLGCGAASFARDPGGGGRRWTNHRSAGRYLAAPAGERVASGETLSPAELACDLVWLGLRTSDGVAAAALEGHAELARWLLAGDDPLCRADGDRIRPTLRGFLHSSSVMRRVLQTMLK
jgi:oxygen-independent coproporphyrinogen-3 oxidase